MRRFIIYGNSYCHLCSEMLAELQQLAMHYTFELEQVEIDGNIELERRYGEYIPVLTRAEDGREICHYHLDQSAFIASLKA